MIGFNRSAKDKNGNEVIVGDYVVSTHPKYGPTGISGYVDDIKFDNGFPYVFLKGRRHYFELSNFVKKSTNDNSDLAATAN